MIVYSSRVLLTITMQAFEIMFTPQLLTAVEIQAQNFSKRLRCRVITTFHQMSHADYILKKAYRKLRLKDFQYSVQLFYDSFPYYNTARSIFIYKLFTIR